MHKRPLPKLSSKAFWSGSVPKEERLFKLWKKGLIVNVFENGTFDDMVELIVYYGRKNVVRTLENVIPLRKRTMNLCCSIFNLKPENFKCYRENRFRPF